MTKPTGPLVFYLLIGEIIRSKDRPELEEVLPGVVAH